MRIAVLLPPLALIAATAIGAPLPTPVATRVRQDAPRAAGSLSAPQIVVFSPVGGGTLTSGAGIKIREESEGFRVKVLGVEGVAEMKSSSLDLDVMVTTRGARQIATVQAGEDRTEVDVPLDEAPPAPGVSVRGRGFKARCTTDGAWSEGDLSPGDDADISCRPGEILEVRLRRSGVPADGANKGATPEQSR